MVGGLIIWLFLGGIESVLMFVSYLVFAFFSRYSAGVNLIVGDGVPSYVAKGRGGQDEMSLWKQ